MGFETEWERKKRAAAERWKMILAYYMMQQIQQRQKAVEAVMPSAFDIFKLSAEFIKENSVLAKFTERGADGKSAVDLLEQIVADEKPNSVFRRLHEELHREPRSEEELSEALTRVVAEVPSALMEEADQEAANKAERQKSYGDLADDFVIVDHEDIEYQQRLRRKMTFLQRILPPALYNKLEQDLRRQRTFSYDEREQEDLGREAPSQPEPQRQTYLQYVAERRVEPKERQGKLANLNDVYTAAAYMIAAYEQKDEPTFDPEKADARAMELSGSRAFRVYMKGHPGSLVAAARNTGVESTHDDIEALDADLKHRDAILAGARDNLKKMATGKTQCFHQMLNALDRFVNADTEPSKQEKVGLVKAMGEYVMKDCAPNSREADAACFKQTMCAMKALVPEKDFNTILDQVNISRDPKVRSEDFDQLEMVHDAPERGEPVRELRPNMAD